jgi:hypothetical protein
MQNRVEIELETDSKLTQDDTEVLISTLHSLGYKTGELKVTNELY